MEFLAQSFETKPRPRVWYDGEKGKITILFSVIFLKDADISSTALWLTNDFSIHNAHS
jgi:hypothetical protein